MTPGTPDPLSGIHPRQRIVKLPTTDDVYRGRVSVRGAVGGGTVRVGQQAEPIVELVDASGLAIGTLGKREAHQPPGRLHRAFSVFLVDAAGGVVLQQRARSKYHSPGLWSNTCCGHPAPGEDPRLAACRRVAEELGLTVAARDLIAVGIVVYAVPDRITGLVEREFDHVFVGPARGRLDVSPSEVAGTRSVPLAELSSIVPSDPDFTSWFQAVFELARPALEMLTDRSASSDLLVLASATDGPRPPARRERHPASRPAAARPPAELGPLGPAPSRVPPPTRMTPALKPRAISQTARTISCTAMGSARRA